MKFEKISSKKFESFESSEIKNLNQILGGRIETSGTNTHDLCDQSGYAANQVDNFVSSPNGTPMSADGVS